MTAPPWESIDTVLLDMDGTLLDRNFDDRFWLEHVPGVYAARRSMPLGKAREELFRVYAAQEGTLNWRDIDYWSEKLGLDIEGMKEDLVRRGLPADKVFVVLNAVDSYRFVAQEPDSALKAELGAFREPASAAAYD